MAVMIHSPPAKPLQPLISRLNEGRNVNGYRWPAIILRFHLDIWISLPLALLLE